jgi:hypothetical protein
MLLCIQRSPGIPFFAVLISEGSNYIQFNRNDDDISGAASRLRIKT